VGAKPHWDPGAKPLVRGPHEADNIFLFQSLISYRNYHIDLGYLDYIANPGARLHQYIMVRGQRDEVPLKLTTFSYLID